ncbi:MAG: iron ABC transporter permease, partial [Planctomycetes bacterium]|nr:iron ABC transporter permease [Planctomycetota bacterium]
MNRTALVLALAVAAAFSWAPLALLFAHVEPRHAFECIDARGLALLGRSALLAGASALLALLVGLPLAWILIRTDVPGARVLRPLCATPLLVPPLLYAIAWT